jgi:hypothetical protein
VFFAAALTFKAALALLCAEGMERNGHDDHE